MLQLHVHISLFLQSLFSPKHLQIEADIAPCSTTVHFISSTEESNQLSQSISNWKNLKPILKKTLSDNNVLEQNKTKPLLVADLKTQRYDEPQSSSESTISQSLTELVEDPEIPAHYFSGNDKDLEDTPDLTPASVLREQADDSTFKPIPDSPVLPLSSTTSHNLPDVNIIAATPIHTAEKVPIAPNLFRTQHDVLEEESLEGDLV